MKIALVYDRINKWGGAERMLSALYELFPQADLYTSVYNPQTAKWAERFNVYPSFLQSFPKAKSSHELYAILMPIAFESFSFDQYDVVISLTSEAAKGIITKPNTMHICICLTPTRYLWSGYDEYFANKFLKFISYPAITYLKHWDLIAAKRPDKYIAISKTVQNRMSQFYGIDSHVIYPPVTFLNTGKDVLENKDKFFLIVSRLVSYKKIDIAVKAAKKLNIKLKIVGTGAELANLKRIAGSTVEFLGALTDKELSYYYKTCEALIFCGNEDFGISLVEAQLFGKPVIAYRSGGAIEIIKEGVTGEFFNEQTVDSLTQVLEKFDSRRYNSRDCIKNAGHFDFQSFKKSFMSFFDTAVEQYFAASKK